MALSLREISDKIHQILWGKSYVDVIDSDDVPHTFILRSLSIHEQNEVKYLRRHELDLARHGGLLCDEELREIYEADGVWTSEEEKRIDDLQDAISRIGTQIKDFEFRRAKKRKLEQAQKRFQKELDELYVTRMNLFNLSAEQRAEEIARRHMVFLSTQTIDQRQFWPSREQFDEYSDMVLLFKLAQAYYRQNQFSEAEIRQIARAGEWRYRWQASKRGESLFGRPIAEWSESQNAIVFWSQYYDSVYDSMDRPPAHVIENDAACDAWVEDQNKKVSAKSSSTTKQDRSALGNKTASKSKNHQEVFMMVQPDDKEAIQEVQEMNPSTIRRKLRMENEQIKNAGGKRIKEWNLGTRSQETPTNIVSKGKGRR